MRSGLACALLVFVTLSACASNDTRVEAGAAAVPPLPEPAPPAAPAATLPLRFAWPVPSHAFVVEDQVKDGEASQSRYRLDISQEGELISVRIRDLVITKAPDGNPPPSERVVALSDALVANAMAHAPALLATGEGDFAGITDVDPMIDAMISSFDEVPEEQKQSMATFLRSAQSKAILEQSYGKMWGSWCCFFAGRELPLSESLVVKDEGGEAIYRVVEMQDGVAVVEMVYTFDSEDLRARMAAMLRNSLQDLGSDPSEAEKVVAQLQVARTMKVRSRLLLDTLQPLSSEREEVTRIEAPGQPVREKREEHRYRFTWKSGAFP